MGGLLSTYKSWQNPPSTHTQSFTVFLEEEEVEKLHRAEVLKGFVYVFKGAKFKDLWWSGE